MRTPIACRQRHPIHIFPPIVYRQKHSIHIFSPIVYRQKHTIHIFPLIVHRQRHSIHIFPLIVYRQKHSIHIFLLVVHRNVPSSAPISSRVTTRGAWISSSPTWRGWGTAGWSMSTPCRGPPPRRGARPSLVRQRLRGYYEIGRASCRERV